MSEKQNNGPQKNNQRNRNNNNRNNNRNRNNRNRNNNNRKPRQNKPKPLVLSGWQKFLIFFKLTSEEKIRKQLQSKRPARNKTPNSNTAKETNNSKPARTNTRVAKERKVPQQIAVETPRLYVGNLSFDATEYDIEDLFKGIGSVKKVEIIYNRHTHKSKGYGFVQMLNVDEAKRAVDVLNDQPFLGRNLIVTGSKARKASDPNSSNYNPDAKKAPETDEASEPVT